MSLARTTVSVPARRAVLLALLAIGAASVGFSQESGYDFGPAKQSIATLEEVASNTRYLAGFISAPYRHPTGPTPHRNLSGGERILLTGRLGPGDFDVWCYDYQNPSNSKKYSYAVPDLGGNDLNLIVNSVKSAAQDTEEFTKPMRHFLKTTVPAISAQFDTALQNILEVQGEVQRGQGNVAAQREKVSYNLEQISGSVNEGAAEIKGLTGQLAIYLDAIKTYNKEISGAVERLDKTIPTKLKELRRKSLEETPCDRRIIDNPVTGTLRGEKVFGSNGNNGINQLEQTINPNLRLIAATPDRIRQSTAPANGAGSVLLGTMVNMLQHVNFVSAQLSKAQSASSLNSAIEQLHIRVAAEAWRDFAAYAKKQVP